MTEKGIYSYNVMPFKRKHAEATYQWLVNRMFMEKMMEVYIDDILVMSKKAEDHLDHL